MWSVWLCICDVKERKTEMKRGKWERERKRERVLARACVRGSQGPGVVAALKWHGGNHRPHTVCAAAVKWSGNEPSVALWGGRALENASRCRTGAICSAWETPSPCDSRQIHFSYCSCCLSAVTVKCRWVKWHEAKQRFLDQMSCFFFFSWRKIKAGVEIGFLLTCDVNWLCRVSSLRKRDRIFERLHAIWKHC